MDKEKTFRSLLSHYKLSRFFSMVYNYLNPKNKLLSKECKLSLGITMLNGLKIINYGIQNKVIIGDLARIKNSTIILHGNGNRIAIGDFTSLKDVEIYMEDDHNEFVVGNHTNFCGRANISLIEGTKISIGDNCLFSGDLHFRTGDSHSIINVDGTRINPSSDIVIENHVWFGTKVTCLKGVHVSENSIVAATTTLTKKHYPQNVVIAGIPGEVIKTNVNWTKERLKIET